MRRALYLFFNIYILPLYLDADRLYIKHALNFDDDS